MLFYCCLPRIQVPEDGVKEYVLSGHSVQQCKRLVTLKDNDLSRGMFLYVEGPHRIWLKKLAQFYFTLRISGAEELLTELDTEGRNILPAHLFSPFSP